MFVFEVLEMDYVEQYLKESPFTAKQTQENEIAYERLMDVRLKLVDLSYEIDRNHDAYMRFMQQTLNSPDLKMRIGKVIEKYNFSVSPNTANLLFSALILCKC